MITFACAASAQAATVNVITSSDPSGLGDCTAPTPTTCSLRQAITAASSNDSVSVPAGTYALTQGTITIAKNLTITGAGPASTTIDGGANTGGGGTTPNRIFKTTSGTVAIGALTLTHGTDGNDENFQSCSPCSTLSGNGGGALFNQGASVSLDNVAFTDNLSSGTPVGGAVANSATLTLTDVSFTNNSAGIGGALFNHSGTLTGTGVTFDSNGNGSFGGGAIYLAGGTASMTNATFTNNGWASSRPGGIENAGASLTLTNDTFSNDIRGSLETDTGGSTTVMNTLLGSDFSDGSDFTCIASGLGNGTGNTSAAAITSENSVGHNLDQDGHCALNADHDQTGVDPHLAPLADNGGPTKTMALLHGSSPAAIDGGASGSCPSSDQRGISRTSGPIGTTCDIGAFEAQLLGSPTAATGAATNVAGTTARFHATINLQDEAGAYHFIYGTAQNNLDQSTPPVGAGVISSNTSVSTDVTGLSPATTYYVKAVADNASGSQTDTGTPVSLTTTAAPPSVTQPTSSNVYDTHATIGAEINPGGADTHWEVDYGTQSGTYDHATTSLDAGFGTTDQRVAQELTGLQPNTTYYFVVKASNNAGAPVTSSELSFTTTPQLTGTEGNAITFTSDQGCPNQNQVTWGDGTSLPGTCTDLGEGGQQLSASHAYAEPGHYDITVGDPADPRAFGGAQIADAPVSATGVTTTATTNVTFSGAVATFADGNHAAPIGDFTATIDWGDGQHTQGTITRDSPGHFTVGGTHLYSTNGSKTVTVSITDVDGSTGTAQSTITTSTPPPTPSVRLASLAGDVSRYVPRMPSTATVDASDPGADVRVDLTVRGSHFRRDTRTDKNSVFTFANLPACNPAAGDTCTVSALDSAGHVLDAHTVTLPAQVRKVQQSLIAGRVSDRFLVGGVVRPPGDVAGGPGSGAGAKTSPVRTNLTISLIGQNGKLTQIYDALKTCRGNRWGDPHLRPSACTSSTGEYLLANVRLPAGGKGPAATAAAPVRAVIALLEAKPDGSYVPVDSASIKLPANTAANNADPPVTTAPTLHAVLPVPAHAGGHTIGGRITLLRPYMPTQNDPGEPAAAREQVALTDSSGRALAHTLTDQNGYYAFSDVARCGTRPRARCTIHVKDPHGSVLTDDTQSVRLPSLSPSVTVIDFTAGKVANRFFLLGGVRAPPDATPQHLDFDLTISLPGPKGTLRKIYDAHAACRHGGWGPVNKPTCATDTGPFLLAQVPSAGRGTTKPRRAVLTLLERNRQGNFVAVDSESIRLPADTARNNAHPPVIRTSSNLLAAVPAPDQERGRTVTGFVENFMPSLPNQGTFGASLPKGTSVRITAVTRDGRFSRTARIDRYGEFAVTGLPACPERDAKTVCSASVIGPSGVVEDAVTFNLPNRTPSSASVHLVNGLLPVSPTIIGEVYGSGPPVETDLQISIERGGSTVVVYDALQACRRGGWLPAPGGPKTGPGACRGTFGGYGLGSVPSADTVEKGAKGPIKATLTLLERASNGSFTAVDSTDIMLPLARGITDGLKLQILAGKLFG